MSSKRNIKSASTLSTRGRDSSLQKTGSKTGRKKASELEKEIITLNDQLELVKEQLIQENENYEQIVKKIVANVNCELFDVDETTDVSKLEIDDIMEMLSTLLTRNYGDEDSIEVRVEELETRVTKQNLDITMMRKQLLLTQYTLEDISKSNELREVKRLAADAVKKLEEAEISPAPPIGYIQSPGGATIVAPATTRDILNSNGDKVDIGPKPLTRLPGTTHINDMKPELRYLVVKELSYNRTSGCDWRLFAERVGISNEVVDRLRHMRVQYPMAKILTTWGESPGATVRMLHRHLTSPQLKWSLLGHHISDTYLVD